MKGKKIVVLTSIGIILITLGITMIVVDVPPSQYDVHYYETYNNWNVVSLNCTKYNSTFYKAVLLSESSMPQDMYVVGFAIGLSQPKNGWFNYTSISPIWFAEGDTLTVSLDANKMPLFEPYIGDNFTLGILVRNLYSHEFKVGDKLYGNTGPDVFVQVIPAQVTPVYVTVTNEGGA